MSPDERRVLAEVCRAAPVAARALAKRLDLPQSTLFRCLTALEDAGLVEAVSPAGDDPLRRRVAPTAAGRRATMAV